MNKNIKAWRRENVGKTSKGVRDLSLTVRPLSFLLFPLPSTEGALPFHF
jgi:hypothetical protein